jgi:hypothetical protein
VDIVGKAHGGEVAGLKTQVVETERVSSSSWQGRWNAGGNASSPQR